MNRTISRILVLGGGAREHALADAFSRESDAREIIVAPGNGGTHGPRIRSMPVTLADPTSIVALAREIAPDLVVVGPEAPLVAGAADALEDAGFLVFGPRKAGARLEASKVFTKELAAKRGIPTARFHVARTMAEAERAIDALGGTPVVKADGLCAGKGVVVADSREEAIEAARRMLEDRIFGEAGAAIVIEERIVGRELSVHAISDGKRSMLLPPARDHKRLLDGDKGPNTGGMGVICPAHDADAALLDEIHRTIVTPTLDALRDEGIEYRGVLFAGIMIGADGRPLLLEHNVRFGDPECEALTSLVTGDFAALLASAAGGDIDPSLARLDVARSAAVVVLTARGYPESPEANRAIDLSAAEKLVGVSVTEGGARIFHAGTRIDERHGLVTAGGRVLAICGVGKTGDEALAHAYAVADAVHFDGKHCRRDIGKTLR